MTVKQRRNIFWILPLIGIVLSICFRQDVAQAVSTGLEQCIHCVIPALFPFFILSNLLTGSTFPELLARRCGAWTARLHLPSAGAAAMVLCFLGGYPIGSAAAVQLYLDGAVTKQDADRLLAACNNTGPAIFFGLAGGLLFPDPIVTLSLYLIHILSAFISTLVLFTGCIQSAAMPTVCRRREICLSDAIWKSTVSCGKICGFVVAFGIVIKLLFRLFPTLPPLTKAVISCFLDLPNGLTALQSVDEPALQFILCSMGINWAGLCVHMQTKAVTNGTGLSMTLHLRYKALQGLLGGILSTAVICFVQGRYLHGTLLCGIIFMIVKTRVAFTNKSRYNKKKWGDDFAVPKKH